MCGRVIQSSGPLRYGIVEGMDMRDSPANNYPPHRQFFIPLATEPSAKPQAGIAVTKPIQSISALRLAPNKKAEQHGPAKRMKWPSDFHMRSMRNADRGERMHVEVETHEAQGMPMPRRIRLDERAIEVAEVLDQWFGADYRYCKIRGDDGAVYILRLDEKRFAWSLTLFTSPKGQALVPQTGSGSA
jgi:hypothetical protein